MSVKKLVLFLILIALALTVNQPLSAQTKFNDITPQQLSQEKALQQADFDTFLKYLEYSANLMKGGMDDSQMTEEKMEQSMQDFLKEAKITPVRMRFIMEKIQILLVSSQDPTVLPKAGTAEAYLIPSDAEKKLLEVNLQKIAQAYETLFSK
jgi:hypothetical protein